MRDSADHAASRARQSPPVVAFCAFVRPRCDLHRAFMQNVGAVNDHIHGCFRATDYRATGAVGR